MNINAFSYIFEEAQLARTSGSDLEHSKYGGQLSTILTLITGKDADLLSCFDENNENEIDNTSLKQILSNNHEIDANKRKIKGQLPLEHTHGFCKLFKKITENLGIHLTFKTANLQTIKHATLGEDIKITIKKITPFVPPFIPNAGTQALFNDSVKNSFTTAFDSWYTDRKIVDDGLKFQVDLSSAQIINSPRYLIGAYQSLARIGVSKKPNIKAVFDNLDVRKKSVETDGYKSPNVGVFTNYAENK